MKRIRPEIRQILWRLRRWIRRYVLLEGLAASIALACLVFWVTFGIDVLYFRASQLELPGWFRRGALFVGITLLAATIGSWILLRLVRRMRAADLALALERRFPELNDRLITAVEWSQNSDSELQNAMLSRVSDEAAQQLAETPLRDAFDLRPLRRMLVAACVLGSSVLALGIADARGVERWYQAYILGRSDYWEPFRRNWLSLHVVALPVERVRTFDEQLSYSHPRGSDLQLVATAMEGSEPPETVTLQFLTLGNNPSRGRVTMSRVGEREYRHTLGRVVDDLHLWIRGGDFTNRSPYRVLAVDPPRVDAIELRCDYPSYTGLDAQEDRPLRVAGTQVALPMETRCELQAHVNKPLVRAILKCDRYELRIGAAGESAGAGAHDVQVWLLDAGGDRIRTVQINATPDDFLSADRMSLRIPLHVSARAVEQLESLSDTEVLPLPTPPDTALQIILEDEDQIISPEPATITLNGIVDQPPVVDTRRTGIGTLVTRNANIPLEGRLTDDYGVTSAWFSFRVDQEQQEQRREFARGPDNRKEFTLEQLPGQPVESFNLIPLKLQEGQTLSLTVYAQDGDDLNGPHSAHGEIFSFKVVSDDELLSRLNDREVTLRQRFEQIRSEVEELRTSLARLRPQIAELASGGDSPESGGAVISAFADRSLHQIRKNHTESRSIEVSFRDLRSEMVNNRIDTRELLERIERRVIEPLVQLNGVPFLEVDRSVGAFRLAVENKAGIPAAADEIESGLTELARQMDAILAEMRDRGTLNDLMNDLQKMIEHQQQLLNETENKRIEENFFAPLK